MTKHGATTAKTPGKGNKEWRHPKQRPVSKRMRWRITFAHHPGACEKTHAPADLFFADTARIPGRMEIAHGPNSTVYDLRVHAMRADLHKETKKPLHNRKNKSAEAL